MARKGGEKMEEAFDVPNPIMYILVLWYVQNCPIHGEYTSYSPPRR